MVEIRLFVATALCALILLSAIFARAGSSPVEAYGLAGDFKAVAESGSGAVGYAWDYDTAADAAEAALVHCLARLPESSERPRCVVTRVGDTLVTDPNRLEEALKRYEDAVLESLRAELARSGEREIITRLSTILQKIGRYEESEALLYDLAMGGEHLAQNALAYHWAELRKNLDRALALADSAVARDPDFFSYHDTRGLVLARLGRMAEAEAEMRKAVELEAHPIALDHYGDLLWMRGKREEARGQWKRAADSSVDILFVNRVQAKLKSGKTGDFVFE